MAGKLIRTVVDGQLRPVGILNTETWDGKNDRGRMCLNGRYLLQIELDDAVSKKQSIYSIALVR
jgi:flagellar hook assembly protein FlgD